MALPFNQSTRALQADRELAPLAIAASTLVLMMLWFAWFVWAPVSLYEMGELVYVTRRGMVVASFPARAADRLYPGQPAFLSVQNDTTPTLPPSSTQQTVTAIIMSVDSDSSAAVIEVVLSSLSARWPPLTLSSGYPISGSVAVEVEQVSPAQLLWRASGQGIDTSAVLLRPASP